MGPETMSLRQLTRQEKKGKWISREWTCHPGLDPGCAYILPFVWKIKAHVVRYFLSERAFKDMFMHECLCFMHVLGNWYQIVILRLLAAWNYALCMYMYASCVC